jgi:ribosomal-protein-alanine N-acetyltransferase
MPRGEEWSAAAIADELSLPGVFGLIEAGGGMVLARVVADEAEILALAVASPARRAGRGAALLAAAEARAQEAGAARMFLEVAVGNTPARTLYGRAGYREVGRRPRYYPDGGDALLMVKLLPTTSA